MKYFPEAATVKDIIRLEGVSKADDLLQDSMKNAAQTAAKESLEKLQDKGQHSLTSVGVKWISTHLQATADHIFKSAGGFVAAYIDFPKKYKGILEENKN